jgi:hypothetical protein
MRREVLSSSSLDEPYKSTSTPVPVSLREASLRGHDDHLEGSQQPRAVAEAIGLVGGPDAQAWLVTGVRFVFSQL